MPRWRGATAVSRKNDSLSWQESVDEIRRLDELHDAQNRELKNQQRGTNVPSPVPEPPLHPG